MGFINCFICKHYILKYDPLNRVVSEKKKKKECFSREKFSYQIRREKIWDAVRIYFFNPWYVLIL